MSYVTILWTMVAASGLVLAVIHGLVWALDRRAYANLAFACISAAGIGMAWTELGMMHAQSAAEWGAWVRWFQIPNFCYIVGTMSFVRLYLGIGRPWLMWTIVALRVGILLVNFTVEPNFGFRSIDSIERIAFLGDQVTIVGHAVNAPRQIVATIATLLSLVYFTDVLITHWRTHRRGERRQGVIVGGGIVFFFAFAVVNSQLVVWGIVKYPTLISPPFLVTLAAMAFEMSRETLRASGLARQLRESTQELQIAAAAAGLGLWSWDAEHDRIQVTDRVRTMFGFSQPNIEREHIAAAIHSDDLPRVHEAIKAAMTNAGEQDVRFRIMRANESRWLVARGHSGFDAQGKLTLMQGVVRDVTDQHRAQEELDELRNALNHAGRVTVLGQLSLAIAHELRQPLGAILFNVSAAENILQTTAPDLQELREIITDIGRDNRRAGEVMDRVRAMLKMRPMNFQPVALDVVVRDVVSLIRQDAMSRGVILETSFDAEVSGAAAMVSGDKVHLSQVLINLVMNAMDAMADTPAAERRIVIRMRAADQGSIELVVVDRGTGIPRGEMEKIFDPFYTTKSAGMGMGLSISRTIIQTHRGRLWAENNPGGGATFHLTLPAIQNEVAQAATA